MIEIQDVTMRFRMANDRVNSLKEFLVQKMRGTLTYKEFEALSHVSIDVKRGEVMGLIGHNGAGKSTLLKLISGIMRPTEGNVTVHGNVVPMLELGSGFDFEMTGRENIFLNGAIMGFEEDFLNDRMEEIIAFSELEEFINMPMRNYSSGMVARLAFAIAALVDPEILIVDEVLSVGDASFQEKSKKRMIQLMSGGTTVLFVSHALEQIRELCDRVVWMERGKVIAIGDSKSICDEYEKSLVL